MTRFMLQSLAVGMALLPAAHAATIDVTAGHDLADRLCIACHNIGDENDQPVSYAPSFRDIVANPAVTELSLRVFHRTAKENMPNIVLMPGQLDEITAYMLSLRNR